MFVVFCAEKKNTKLLNVPFYLPKPLLVNFYETCKKKICFSINHPSMFIMVITANVTGKMVDELGLRTIHEITQYYICMYKKEH